MLGERGFVGVVPGSVGQGVLDIRVSLNHRFADEVRRRCVVDRERHILGRRCSRGTGGVRLDGGEFG